jgi:hypothetical protein
MTNYTIENLVAAACVAGYEISMAGSDAIDISRKDGGGLRVSLDLYGERLEGFGLSLIHSIEKAREVGAALALCDADSFYPVRGPAVFAYLSLPLPRS